MVFLIIVGRHSNAWTLPREMWSAWSCVRGLKGTSGSHWEAGNVFRSSHRSFPLPGAFCFYSQHSVYLSPVRIENIISFALLLLCSIIVIVLLGILYRPAMNICHHWNVLRDKTYPKSVRLPSFHTHRSMQSPHFSDPIFGTSSAKTNLSSFYLYV
jgi:hypothetical protein